MKKKIVSVMLIAAMAVSFTAGCGSGGGDTAKTEPKAPAGEGGASDFPVIRRSAGSRGGERLHVKHCLCESV